ncbi:MAG: signal peptidase I, partial [Chloroflexi bacterium]
MRQRRALGCLFEIVETLVLTLVIFLVIQTFIAQPYRVEQQSMERTLEPDQYVLVDKLTPRFDTYKRGDIVVFNPPPQWVQSAGTPFIKRVIGIGRDTVEVRDGKVYVNGVALSEPYVFKADGTAQSTETSNDPPKWVVPDG